MSATRTLPACSRPGSSRCPGLRRKNVMLSLAFTAAPITAPLAPLIPLGRSTAMIVAPLAFIASISARASPSTTRFNPAPNSASTITPAPAIASGAAASTGPRPRASRPSAASPLQRRGIAEQHHAAPDSRARTARAPPRTRRRHCCPARPRPATRVPSGWRATASATALPAFSISAMPGTPDAIASRSHAAISSGVRSSIIADQDSARAALSRLNDENAGNRVLAEGCGRRLRNRHVA